MLNASALTVQFGALSAIGILPLVFFRRGEHNLRWWLTAWPFVVSGAALLLGALGVLEPWRTTGAFATLLAVVSAGGSLLGVALIALTVGVHRVPLCLWHQDADGPVEIVDWGPYRVIRHPFYAAFIVILACAALAFPHVLTVLAVVCGAFALNRTAASEEQRLLASSLGDRYSAYIARTGRFLPARHERREA